MSTLSFKYLHLFCSLPFFDFSIQCMFLFSFCVLQVVECYEEQPRVAFLVDNKIYFLHVLKNLSVLLTGKNGFGLANFNLIHNLHQVIVHDVLAAEKTLLMLQICHFCSVLSYQCIVCLPMLWPKVKALNIGHIGKSAPYFSGAVIWRLLSLPTRVHPVSVPSSLINGSLSAANMNMLVH